MLLCSEENISTLNPIQNGDSKELLLTPMFTLVEDSIGINHLFMKTNILLMAQADI